MLVSILVAAQVPVMLLSEVVGNASAVAPSQYVVVKLNVGVNVAFTVTDTVTASPHWLAVSGVNI